MPFALLLASRNYPVYFNSKIYFIFFLLCHQIEAIRDKQALYEKEAAREAAREKARTERRRAAAKEIRPTLQVAFEQVLMYPLTALATI